VDNNKTFKQNHYNNEHSSFLKLAFKDYFSQAIKSITANKLRSFLSLLGILIGVSTVITMIAVGEGAKTDINTKLSTLGSNLPIVHPGYYSKKSVAIAPGKISRLTIHNSLKKLNLVKYSSPIVVGHYLGT